jgi:peroxiredoxin 2/4
MKKSFLLTAVLLLALGQLWSQTGRSARTNNIPLLGVQAPSFTAESTTGTLNFPGDFGSNWKILFSHPKDFTPVCSSELLELAYHQENFSRLGVNIAVISTDILSQHFTWKAALEEIAYKGKDPVKIGFPLIEDNNYRVANLYGMIHSAESRDQNVRGVFIIDPENKVRSIHFYPNEVGRNIDELVRTVVALQSVQKDRHIVTPANWMPGDDFMVPVITAGDRANLGMPESEFYQYSWFMTFRKKK